MKKRIFVLFLSAILLLGVTGCGNGELHDIEDPPVINSEENEPPEEIPLTDADISDRAIEEYRDGNLETARGLFEQLPHNYIGANHYLLMISLLEGMINEEWEDVARQVINSPISTRALSNRATNIALDILRDMNTRHMLDDILLTFYYNAFVNYFDEQVKNGDAVPGLSDFPYYIAVRDNIRAATNTRRDSIQRNLERLNIDLNDIEAISAVSSATTECTGLYITLSLGGNQTQTRIFDLIPPAFFAMDTADIRYAVTLDISHEFAFLYDNNTTGYTTVGLVILTDIATGDILYSSQRYTADPPTSTTHQIHLDTYGRFTNSHYREMREDLEPVLSSLFPFLDIGN
jgi:hypothetical protein